MSVEWKKLGRKGKKRITALIIVQANSIFFDLFSLLCHDCLVGGNTCCGVFGVLPHGWPVAIPHNIHLMWVACTHNGLLCFTFFYHPSNLYLASAHVPFYEDIAILIILNHPVDYGLYRNREPTSIGPDGLFVEPSLNALIKVLINLMCKADFNWNVTKYSLLNTTMVITGSGSVVLSTRLRKILQITGRWPLRYNVYVSPCSGKFTFLVLSFEFLIWGFSAGTAKSQFRTGGLIHFLPFSGLCAAQSQMHHLPMLHLVVYTSLTKI